MFILTTIGYNDGNIPYTIVLGTAHSIEPLQDKLLEEVRRRLATAGVTADNKEIAEMVRSTPSALTDTLNQGGNPDMEIELFIQDGTLWGLTYAHKADAFPMELDPPTPDVWEIHAVVPNDEAVLFAEIYNDTLGDVHTNWPGETKVLAIYTGESDGTDENSAANQKELDRLLAEGKVQKIK